MKNLLLHHVVATAWLLGVFLFRWSGLVVVVQAQQSINSVPPPENADQKTMEQWAFSTAGVLEPNIQATRWKTVLEAHPTSFQANLQLGLLFIGNLPKEHPLSVQGFLLLEGILLEPAKYSDVLKTDSMQTFMLRTLLGRWRWERKEYALSKRHLLFAEENISIGKTDVCLQGMLATMLDVFPSSIEMADAALSESQERLDRLLALPSLQLDLELVNIMDNDAYAKCFLSSFYHSFYYRGDAQSHLAKVYSLVARALPELANYESKGLLPFNDASKKTNDKPIVSRKLRMGIVSGFFRPGSSVVDDFQGVLKRLDTNVFDLTYIVVQEFSLTGEDLPELLQKIPSSKILYVRKQVPGYHEWVHETRTSIEALQLDMMYYLDATMSGLVQRLAMSRLAPVQLVSHGHPMTSGIPSNIMNYFISWGAAELPTAQDHYTEQLKLLPADSIHQYYDRRTYTKNDIKYSRNDNQPYSPMVDAGRQTSFPEIPSDGTWYLCMQKPFKLHPEFDTLVAGIMRQDPNARVLLHAEDSEYNRNIFVHRLGAAGCDMDRVHFVPVQPHSSLLALYSLSDVILDSYPAGGCTTTREVLELGKAFVTLPAKYLGSRWSMALLQMLGASIDDVQVLLERLVATSEQDYVDKAVALGTNKKLRQSMEHIILTHVDKLFGRWEAVEAWTNILLEIAPVLPEAAASENRRRSPGMAGDGYNDEL